MKILQINNVVNSGSTGRIVEEIGGLLLEKGYESYIAHGSYAAHRGKKPESKSKLIKIGKEVDSYIHGVYTLLTDKHGFASKNATQSFISKLDKLKPDLVGLHNLHGYYINIELLFDYLKKNKIPVVWTLFDCWAFTGHCSYYNGIDCTKWQVKCYECPKTSKYPKSYVDNSTRNFEDKRKIFNSIESMEIITHSKWLSGEVKKSFLGNYKTHVTPSAINLNLFKRIKSNLKEKYNIKEKVVLGCASVWSERKGLPDFIKLSKLLSEDYKIVLIGLNDNQLKLIPENILGLKRTNSIEELAQWYTLASVFVNPTTQDNFPTTNLESLACGTPVITYNTGGSPEAIDESTGRVVEKNDVESLVKSISEICSKDQKIISKNCRQRAEKLYDKKTRYMDYLNIFEELITKSKH